MSAVREIQPAVRLMEEEDLPQVMAIERRAYPFPWSEGIFRDCRRAGYCCLVSAADDHVFGYAILMPGPAEAHILNICVDPRARRAGHARRLMDSLLEMAEMIRAERVFLEVRPSNKAARELYADYGFYKVGRRKDYYPADQGREDALVMECMLLPNVRL
jgi:ribosomal-protein-alanine N-acetyltransferase